MAELAPPFDTTSYGLRLAGFLAEQAQDAAEHPDDPTHYSVAALAEVRQILGHVQSRFGERAAGFHLWPDAKGAAHLYWRGDGWSAELTIADTFMAGSTFYRYGGAGTIVPGASARRAIDLLAQHLGPPENDEPIGIERYVRLEWIAPPGRSSDACM